MNRKKLVTEMGRISGDDFRNAEKLPLVVVLDNVRSLHNVGSVFRTSDAFRVQRILLCGITATPPNAEIHKTALGAEDVVEWQYFVLTKKIQCLVVFIMLIFVLPTQKLLGKVWF